MREWWNQRSILLQSDAICHTTKCLQVPEKERERDKEREREKERGEEWSSGWVRVERMQLLVTADLFKCSKKYFWKKVKKILSTKTWKKKKRLHLRWLLDEDSTILCSVPVSHGGTTQPSGYSRARHSARLGLCITLCCLRDGFGLRGAVFQAVGPQTPAALSDPLKPNHHTLVLHGYLRVPLCGSCRSSLLETVNRMSATALLVFPSWLGLGWGLELVFSWW